MTAADFDTITFCVWMGMWPVWLIWEIVLILLRKWWRPKDGARQLVMLISMVARDRGWQLNSVVYTWFGLGAHFWWNAAAWGPAWMGVCFWAGVVILFVCDIANWNSDVPRADWPKWRRWVRYPLLWMVVGTLAGRILFPQSGPTPWNWILSP